MNEPDKLVAASVRKDVPTLLRHFFEAYPSRTLTVIALLSAAGLAEGVSVLALLPFVQLALAGNASQASMANQWVSRGLALAGLTPTIGSLLLFIVVGISAKAALSLLAMKEAGYAFGQTMTDLRQRLILALMGARWSYFVKRPLGLFANAIGAETIRAGVAYQQSARLVAAFIQALVYGAATVIISWKIALFAIVAGTAGAVMFRKVLVTAHDSGGRQTDLMQSLAIRTTDTLQGIKAIKAMGVETSSIPLLDREIRELDAEQNIQVWTTELLHATQEPLLVIFLATGLYGAVEIGGESLTTLMVISAFFYRLFSRFQIMQEIYQQIGIGVSAYWSIFGLCEEAEREGERSAGAKTLQNNVPRIDIDNVSFHYGEKEVLHNISLRIEPGEFVVISGPSGGGKTTLLDIISGLLSPTSGHVLIGDNDLVNLDLRLWRGRIGYVPQDLLLLHDTVFRNISLGDETVSRSTAEAALRAAGVWDVIAGLPEGLNTIVGERGSRFSGGQRQRISLARALARQPSVLLLDEITASLDKDTEQDVCATLRHLAGKKMTVVAVSHQNAVKEVADRILQLENGKLHARLRDLDIERRVGASNAV